MTQATIDSDIYRALEESVGEEFVAEMIEAFQDEGRKFLSDMDSALANQDGDRLRRAAHSLKSNAATFGAMELSRLAKEVEELVRTGEMGAIAGKLGPISAAFSQAEQALKELKHG